MQELEISLYLAIVAGAFTIAGFVTNSVLQYFTEKSKFEREKKEKENQITREIKTEYLSPLCFYFSKIRFDYFPDKINLKKFTSLLQICFDIKILDAIDELVKKNMHNLPPLLNIDILWFTSCLRDHITMLSGISKILDEMTEEEEKQTSVPKKIVEGIKKNFELFTKTRNKLTSCVYSYMTINKDYTKSLDLDKLHKELIEANNEMTQAFDELISKHV